MSSTTYRLSSKVTESLDKAASLLQICSSFFLTQTPQYDLLWSPLSSNHTFVPPSALTVLSVKSYRHSPSLSSTMVSTQSSASSPQRIPSPDGQKKTDTEDVSKRTTVFGDMELTIASAIWFWSRVDRFATAGFWF
jgi:hypothetical protein